MNRYCILFLFLLSLQPGVAQTSTKSIQVLATSKKEGVWLRWAPTNPTVWELGNKHGYIIERFKLLANGDLEKPSGDRLNPEPLKPYPLSELQKLASSVPGADVLAEILYGEVEGSSSKNTDLGNILAKQEELENKFGVALLVCDLSTEVAKAAGLFYKDENITKGERYIYRISLAKQPTGITIEPGVLVVDADEEKPLQKITDLKADFRDQTVTLNWSTLFHQGTYSFYYIEKSTDGKSFQRISDLPYIHMSETPDSEFAYFVDSLDVNSKTYYYRIVGATPFGELGSPSNIVQGEGKDDLSGLLIIREITLVDNTPTLTPKSDPVRKSKTKGNANKSETIEKNKAVSLVWEFPLEMEGKINGFIISRSNNADGPYTDITLKPLNKTIRKYTDQTPYHNTYYVISAINAASQEVSRSYPFLVQVEDNTPPAIPVGLAGTIDQQGIASLNWTANTDPDIMGYRVFRSNSTREEPVEVTKSILPKPYFNDTINVHVLNKDVFYHVVAVDKNFNASDYSLPLLVKRSDVIPPAAPVFIKAEVNKDTIKLVWKNSVSTDVRNYELIRIEKENRLSRVIQSWTPASLKESFNDISLEPGITYQYKVVVSDSAGNTSQAITREIYFEPGYRKTISNFKSTTDRESKTITLTWTHNEKPTKALIYRKTNEGNFVLYKTILGSSESFTDTQIQINNIYWYKVQLVFQNSIKSLLSNEIIVNF